MPRSFRRAATAGLLAVTALVGTGCATLQELANLQRVDFALAELTRLELAGVDLTRVRGVDDLRAVDLGRIALALSRDELPLEFVLGVDATNPADAGGRARLTRMEWTLLLEDRETITGRIDREYPIEPGATVRIDIPVGLDLLEFFEGNAAELAELALSLAQGGEATTKVGLRAVPTIETPLGAMRYPEPILIEGTIGR